VGGWSAAANEGGVGGGAQRGEGAEVIAGGGAFDAEQRVDVGGGGCGAEEFGVALRRGPQCGLMLAGGIPGGTKQELPAVVDLAGYEALSDGQPLGGVFVGLVLRAAQQRVASRGPTQPSSEPAVCGDPVDGALVVGAP
jgi:hypothetical protein